MKKVCILAVTVILAFVLLRTVCPVASNQQLVNKLNPVWEVQGHVLSEHGKPISDVALEVSYAIGYYPIGRILEQSAGFEHQTLRPDTNGFFSIRKRCGGVFIRVAGGGYQIVGSAPEQQEIVFSKELPDSHTMSDKNLKLVLRPVFS